MSEPEVRAILYCPDAYIRGSDGGEYHENLFELIEEDSIERVVQVAAAAVPLRGELAPSLWIPDLDLTERAVVAFAKIMGEWTAAQDRKAREQAKYSARARALKLRMRIAELESGDELAKAKRDLEALEAASLAPGGEA